MLRRKIFTWRRVIAILILLAGVPPLLHGCVASTSTTAMLPGGTVTGRVQLSGENDHSGALVYVVGVSLMAISDPSGQFSIYNIPPGVYTVTAQKEGFRSKSVSHVQVKSNETTSIGTIVLERGSPRVISTNPEDGETDVPLLLWQGDMPALFFTVEFNQPMSKQKTEAAISFSPPLGDALWFIWWTSREVSMVPHIPRPPAREEPVQPKTAVEQTNYPMPLDQYTIIVGTGAESLLGVKLAEEYRATFTFERTKVIETRPGDGETEVSTGIDVEIYFNAPMDTASAEAAFSMVDNEGNPISGSFSWDGYSNKKIIKEQISKDSGDNTRMYFRPDAALQSETTYTVTIAASAAAENGVTLGSDYIFSFTTAAALPKEAPQVVSTYPQNGESGVLTSVTVQVTFNTLMDHASVEAAFKMVDQYGSGVAGQFSWKEQVSQEPVKGAASEGSSTLCFTPDAPLQEGTGYTVTIFKSAMSQEAVQMENDYSFSLTTESAAPQEAPQVVQTYPKDGEADVPTSVIIKISFNVPMDEASVKGAFQMMDEFGTPVPGQLFWNSSQDLGFTPDQLLSLGTKYTVTIFKSAKSQEGVPMENDYSFSFITAK